jgi:hypothetical protein
LRRPGEDALRGGAALSLLAIFRRDATTTGGPVALSIQGKRENNAFFGFWKSKYYEMSMAVLLAQRTARKREFISRFSRPCLLLV